MSRHRAEPGRVDLRPLAEPGDAQGGARGRGRSRSSRAASSRARRATRRHSRTPRRCSAPRSPAASSATGSLTALTEQNLGFIKGGQLTAVNVKVGDHVTTGQVLATVDPFAAQQALDQARGQLRTQQATLNKVTDSPVVTGSQDTLDQAKKILPADQGPGRRGAGRGRDGHRQRPPPAQPGQEGAQQGGGSADAAKAACGSGSSSSSSGSGSSSAPTSSPSTMTSAG